MPVLKVFELHTYRNGSWKIDSVFDDRDLALMEADRVDRSNRYSAVRVVEETFDEDTEKGRHAHDFPLQQGCPYQRCQ